VRALLDTCILSELRRPKGSAAARAAVDAVDDGDLFLSVLSIGELAKGIALVKDESAILVSGLDNATLVIAMVETPLSVENVDRIAAVPGLDALLIGTNDLCLEMGIPGQLDHERVKAAFDTVLSACKKHGKIPALGGIYGKDLLTRYLGLGFRMILAGNDISLLYGAAQEQANFVRGLGGAPPRK